MLVVPDLGNQPQGEALCVPTRGEAHPEVGTPEEDHPRVATPERDASSSKG